MREYEIRQIYNLYRGPTKFYGDELSKYDKFLNEYLNDREKHLFVNDRACESLPDNEMKEKYSSGEYFNTFMFKNDDECNEYRNNELINIFDHISYKTFCIHKEIEALIYFNKSIDEIIKILNDKYYILDRDI